MKKILTLVLIILTVNGTFSQEETEKKEQKSKISDFISKKGSILKFEDFNLPNVKASLYIVAESKIRKITNANQIKYFLQISKKDKYGSSVASIAYEDIIEIKKALEILKDESVIDLPTNSDYLENKFISDDDFTIGYYINKSKISWYMKLENYGSDNTLFMKTYEDLVKVFEVGKEKIEVLKK